MNKTVAVEGDKLTDLKILYREKIEPILYMTATALTALLSVYIVVCELSVMF